MMIDAILENGIQLIIGSGLSFLISFLAYMKRSLAFSGFIAATIMGSIIYFTGGLYFMMVLLFFFVSSSVLSKFSTKEKVDSLRSYKQVFANGIIGTLLSILFYVFEDSTFKLLYTISFAVSTADTWASEIGKFSKSLPVHIIRFEKLEQGLSGGITKLGTAASLLGSLIMSLFMSFNLYVIVFGFLGSIVDSLLGTIQVKYICGEDEKLCETPDEKLPVLRTTGLKFLSNNLVNFISNLTIVGLAAFIV